MTFPISGPFTRTQTIKGPPYPLNEFTWLFPDWVHKAQTWSRQAKPYDLVLPYHMEERRVVSSTDYRNYDAFGLFDQGQMAQAANKARADLVSQLGESSMWLTNALEMKSTMQSITSTFGPLIKAVRQIHRNDFHGAARTLKTPVPRGLKPTSKAFGDNWLKYHFGWEPLVKDIGAAVSTLQSPLPSKDIRGKGSVSSETYTKSSGDFWTSLRVLTRTGVRTGCTVKVNNPNLFLANQLGFVNPASVAWEAVPFSFVVDWFVPVGAFLSQWTDFAGVTVSRPWSTVLQTSLKSETWYSGSHSVYQGTYLDRIASIPDVTLVAKPFKGVSAVRGATACALLIQQLRH